MRGDAVAQVGTSATCDGNTRGAIRWTGAVFEGCTTNGWESLSTASTTPTTPSGPAWTQLQGPPQTFANDTWNGVQFSSAPIANNIRTIGRSVNFTFPGVYRVTLSYRNGAGPDVWTAARLQGAGHTRGLSVAGANLLNSPELTTWEFLAAVEDVTVPYEIQLGRAGGSLALATPADVAGQALPAVQATVQRIGALGTPNAAQFEGPGQTWAANAWTGVFFDGASQASSGWTLGSNGRDIRFPSTGTWRVTLSYRAGSGGDVWTGARIFGSGSTRGQSAGTGNFANSSELVTFDFLANIADASVNYQLQLGRLSDAQAPVGSPTLAGGVLIPAVQATFSLIPSAKAFAQLEAAPATFASGAWTAVNFASAPLNNGITLSGTNITVPRAGTYRVTLSYRNGTGGDVWTAIRLFGDGTTRGISAGTGNISPSPELFTYSFLADIANPAVPYQIQLGRHSSTLAIATPAAIAGQTPPAIVATIEEL